MLPKEMLVPDMDSLQKLIRSVAAERLEGVDVLETQVERAAGEDGDPILLVNVIYDDAKGRPPVAVTIPFLRHLVTALTEEADEEAFPVVSYVAVSEVSQLDPDPDQEGTEDAGL